MHEAAVQDRVHQEAVPYGGLSSVQKLACLIRLLPTRPAEFWGRLTIMAEVRAEAYRRQPCTMEPVEWSRAMSELSRLSRIGFDSILRETELETVEQETLHLMRTMPKDAPFGSFHNGDLGLSRLCYALARVIQPRAIIETGVCYGVTSAFLLQALQVNRFGVLHSIDLPPLGKDADQFVGRLIPVRLCGDWKLHRGPSKRLLPKVLKEVGDVGLFVHDSLHTHRNMLRELETVGPCLSPKAAVVADDIEGNEAFHEWVAKARPQYSVALHEQSKQSLLGVALFCRNSTLSHEDPLHL
jgi:Methyltransferase domain